MNKDSLSIYKDTANNIAVLNSPHHETNITEYNDDDISHMIYEIRG